MVRYYDNAMAMTLMQRLRLWWKGSQRRREEFGKTNATWGSPAAPTPPPAVPGDETRQVAIDRDGILSAYLDQSGRTSYYLDLTTGEVVESTSSSHPRIPTMNEEQDRAAFIAAHNLTIATTFRETIARDRTLERAWYNFKTQRANEAIDAWLKSIRRS
jgi:hypothetical protein